METKAHRVAFIGVARGIGIFWVVLAHTLVPEMRTHNPVMRQIFHWVCSFSMPLYTMLSGYLFERSRQKYREAGFVQFVLRKFQALMVPYFSYSVICYAGLGLAFLLPATAAVLTSSGYASIGLQDAVWRILTYQNHVGGHLWFLYALFLVFVVSFLFDNALRHPLGLLATLGLFVIVTVYAEHVPAILANAVYLLFFFSAARRPALVDTLRQERCFLPLLLSYAALYAVQAAGWLEWSRAWSALLVLVVGCAGAALAANLSSRIANTGAGRAAGALGKHSFAVYLLHQPFIVSGLSSVLLRLTNLPTIAICAATLCFGIALPILVNKLVISRTKWLRGPLLGDFSKNSPSTAR